MLAVGGTAVVYEVTGASPAVLKWARWGDRDIQARFAVEAEVLRCVGQPATPQLIAHGAADGWPYLIMEHVTGETLAAWMSRNQERGGLGEVVAILTRITNALGAVHEAGYVHRDLKPENITIGPRGARLLDFGLAKPLQRGKSLTQIGTIVGTPHYMAPEQIRMGGGVDEHADIYSLGVIAYEMLVGVPPFVGERRAIEYQHQVGRPPSIRESRNIPAELEEVVARCLAKQPDARPRSAAQVREELAGALTSAGTLRGIGGVTPSAPIKVGDQAEVVLAWIAGGDPGPITRAIAEVQGIVARQRGDGIVAAFTAREHESPLASALAVCRDLERQRCRIVVHVTSALVRRSAQSKTMVYGKELERVESWTPSTPFVGLVLTPAAAERAQTRSLPAADVPGFLRQADTAGNATVETRGTFVGRSPLLERVAAYASHPVVLGLSGEHGTGKTRFLDELAAKLRAMGRTVVHIRARRRFLGDRPDDDRVVQALGGQASRNTTVLVDDVERLSRSAVEHLLGPGPLTRIVTSAHPLFEVAEGGRDRVAIELAGLSHADAGVLLREQLRPARLIPDVLIDRLALRGVGNPRLLLALAHDMKRRGAVRRHAGSDEWYVAADELDTLLAPPSPSWLAHSALDAVPPEVAPMLRACTALGPRFCADELAHVTSASPSSALAFLHHKEIVIERNGWYELEDATLQQAIYEHLLDERDVIHARALAYWRTQETANHLGRLARIAYHATRAGEHRVAAASWLTLSRAARRRGESEHADHLLAEARTALATDLDPAVRSAIAAVDDE
jgi:hypothetical protein